MLTVTKQLKIFIVKILLCIFKKEHFNLIFKN